MSLQAPGFEGPRQVGPGKGIISGLAVSNGRRLGARCVSQSVAGLKPAPACQTTRGVLSCAGARSWKLRRCGTVGELGELSHRSWSPTSFSIPIASLSSRLPLSRACHITTRSCDCGAGWHSIHRSHASHKLARKRRQPTVVFRVGLVVRSSVQIPCMITPYLATCL